MANPGVSTLRGVVFGVARKRARKKDRRKTEGGIIMRMNGDRKERRENPSLTWTSGSAALSGAWGGAFSRLKFMETLHFILTVFDLDFYLALTAMLLGYSYCLVQYKRDFRGVMKILDMIEKRLEMWPPANKSLNADPERRDEHLDMKQPESLKSSISHASNVASCLANGIIPDWSPCNNAFAGDAQSCAPEADRYAAYRGVNNMIVEDKYGIKDILHACIDEHQKNMQTSIDLLYFIRVLSQAQEIIVKYLVPDGISAEEAIKLLIPVLDNQELTIRQRKYEAA
jgi:hypothetical protein